MKLIDVLKGSSKFFDNLLLEDRIDVLRDKYRDKINKQDLERIIEADPTKNKEYTQWLLNQYLKVVKPKGTGENLDFVARRTFLEDLDIISEALLIFHTYKRKFEKRDINQYTPSELKVRTGEVMDSLDDTERTALGGQHKFYADESKFPEYKIGNVAGYTVWKLPQKDDEAEAAACDLGQNTSWCTRSGAFKTYNRKDPLYIFIGKGKKYQFHFTDRQFKNIRDIDMENGPLRDAFLEFLEKYEGRVTADTSIEKYKVGDFRGPDGVMPLYKVGTNKYYTNINNTEVFYNPDDGLLKTKSGKTIADPSVIFTYPYIAFLKEVYRQLKESGDTKGFRGIYRLLLDLDIPDKGPDHWWSIPGDLSLVGSQLTKLPEGLHIGGDLDITDSTITELPTRIKVDGEIIR